MREIGIATAIVLDMHFEQEDFDREPMQR